MKTEDEINEIVTAEGGVKMKVGKFPTYLNKIKMEGFRIELGKIRSFWIKDEQMVFGESPSQAWQKVLDEIQGQNKKSILTDTELPEIPQQNESTEIADRFVPTVTEPVLIPPQFTMPLLEKWKKMTTFERMLMFQTTPQDRIEERKGRGGKMFKYVKGNFMDQEANIAFLFGMSSKIDGWHLGQDGVACYGSISFQLDGQTISSSGVGIDLQEYSGTERKPVFTIPEMMKNAHTDMKKKALSAKGFNGDIYRGEL